MLDVGTKVNKIILIKITKKMKDVPQRDIERVS